MIHRYMYLLMAVLLYFSSDAPAGVARSAPHSSSISTIQQQDPESLSEEEMRKFLLTGKVIQNKSASKGITGIRRLTLTDGTITHDAGFQPINEYKPKFEANNGQVEREFHDSWKYDVAAFELAKLVGLGDMMPVTVERKIEGATGALSWWLPAKLDEEKRFKDKITPPDPDAWNKQMYKMRVFSQLVYDTDRNLGNVLISANWHLWMIDFSRAFRIYNTLEDPKNLVKCERKLLQNLRQLKAGDVEAATKKWLSVLEIKGIMARRDKIVALFDKMIATKGEAEVLYD
jgi:hypothetical protein